MTLFIFLLSMAINSSKAFEEPEEGFNSKIVVHQKNQAIENTAQNDMKYFTLSKIVILAGAMSDGTISYITEIGSIARNKGNLLPVNAILTNSEYINFEKLDMIKGTFLNPDACKNGRKIVVISSNLAKKLFSTYNIIGEEIDLLGDKYKIAGIYEPHYSIISLMGADGAEKVFLPLESIKQYEEQPIQTLLIKDVEIEQDKFRVNTIGNMLKINLGQDQVNYKILDYYNAHVELTQFKSIFIFFLGVYIIWVLAAYLIKHIKKSFKAGRELMNESYVSHAVKANWKDLLKSILVAALYVAGIFVIYNIVKFTISIPLQYIPADNIFDFGFYIDKLKEAFRIQNTSYGYVPTQFEVDFNNIYNLQLFFLACAALAFFLSISEVKMLMLAEESFLTLYKAYIIAFFSAILLALVFSAACSLPYVFAAKELFIVLVLYVLCSKYKRTDKVERSQLSKALLDKAITQRKNI